MNKPKSSKSPRNKASHRFVADYLAALLAQASHLISSEFHKVVRKNGLSISEWRVLASLADSEPVSIGRLAELALTKQPTVTRLLDRMEARATCSAWRTRATGASRW